MVIKSIITIIILVRAIVQLILSSAIGYGQPVIVESIQVT